jgi:hypothetical protein
VPDVIVMEGRTRVVLTALNEEARAWLLARLPKGYTRLGAGYEIERRYVQDIIRGLRRRGFRVQAVV